MRFVKATVYLYICMLIYMMNKNNSYSKNNKQLAVRVVCKFSLDINFYAFNGYIFIFSVLISTHPHFYVISGGLWQLSVEPGRVVHAAACTTNAPPIPQWVGQVNKHASCYTTEIPIVNECGGFSTRTPVVLSSKCPDMVSGNLTMSKADSIHIVRIYS